jgi:predicted MFS family arabinose efflux permease
VMQVGRYAWYVLGILCLVYACNWMDRYVLVILLEPIKNDLHLSDAQLGLLSGFAFATIYSLTGIPIARWADRGVRRSLIAVGLSFWSLMTAASGLAHSFGMLLAARLGVAVGESTCSPAASSLIAHYFPSNRRATAFALYGLGISLGMGLGLILGGWLNELHGWRVAFLVVGCPGLLLALLVRTTIREPERGGGEGSSVAAPHYSMSDAVRAVLTRKSFLAYAVGLGLFSFSGNAFETWTPVYLVRSLHMGTGAVGTLSGLVEGIGGVIGTLGGGLLADRLGRGDERWYLWLPATTSALMVPCMWGFLHSDHGVMFVFYFVTLICTNAYMAPMVAITQKVMPLRLRAFSTALLYLVLNLIGPGAGPWVAGILNDVFTGTYGVEAVRVSLGVTLIGAVFGVLLTVFAARRLPADIALLVPRGSSRYTPLRT